MAAHFSTVILSADSRQFYKELNIGTAKPDANEQQGIKHYFIDSHSIHENITAADYAKEALGILEKEFQNHDTIIMVGGSGMFIDAVCVGLDDIPASTELRDILTAEVKKNGLKQLLEELEEKDPEFFQIIDRNNPVRVIRAIEAIRLSGKKFSVMRMSNKHIHSFEIKKFIIDLPRELLYERINTRVEQMIEKGLVDEVKNLYPFRNLNPLRTVGYSELFSFFDGLTAYDKAIDLIKQNSRNYAKRQLTWFRKHEDAVKIPIDSTQVMLNNILNKII